MGGSDAVNGVELVLSPAGGSEEQKVVKSLPTDLDAANQNILKAIAENPKVAIQLKGDNLKIDVSHTYNIISDGTQPKASTTNKGEKIPGNPMSEPTDVARFVSNPADMQVGGTLTEHSATICEEKSLAENASRRFLAHSDSNMSSSMLTKGTEVLLRGAMSHADLAG